MFIDSRNMTAACDDLVDGDAPALPEDLVTAARKTVASFAVGDTLAEQVADTEVLMTALGIHPNQVPDATTRVSTSDAAIRGSHF